MLRTRGLKTYSAEIDDWAWYGLLPLLSYIVILVSGTLLVCSPWARIVFFALAGATLLLVFVGIRNAWDVVTYLAIRPDPEDEIKN